MVNALHQHSFSTLNPNLQNLIASSFQNPNGTITCKLKAGNHKSDIVIQIGSEKHTYSVKMGKGNSIHQESLHEFIRFLEQSHQLAEPIKSYIQEFIWGDGTTNGLGKISHRVSSRTFNKSHPQKIKAIQRYFNTIKPELIKRFLVSGSDNASCAEYLYYGSVQKGYLCTMSDALRWLTQHNSKAVLHIGKLNFQAWNRNLKGKASSEHKRGFVQVKWSGLKKDIQKISTQHNSVEINPYLFRQLFSHTLLAAGASLYTKEHKLFLNEKLLTHWGVSHKEFFAYYKEKLDLPIDSVKHLNCQKCLQEIQAYARGEIQKRIIEEF
ncbi:MAG TPA: hypothetical protein ENK95_03845, partial [Campylobacterales bacterium]|nr:hypothetical protein [Campylobacterales bacterium]